MDIQSVKRDSAAVEGGRWVSDIPGMGDLRLKVRGFTSQQARALRARLERAVPNDGRDRDGRLTIDAQVQVVQQVLLQEILLDWDGLTDAGEAIGYNRDLAEKWLTDPDYMPFSDAVTYAAGVVDRSRGDEESAGN